MLDNLKVVLEACPAGEAVPAPNDQLSGGQRKRGCQGGIRASGGMTLGHLG
jgi:hypothetical protein